MNEQRHFYKQRFGTEQPSNQTKETKEQLLAAVLSFIDKNRSITATDWMALDGIIKQLENEKSNHPKKVLKAMERKFEEIKLNYQYQR